jgi:hypothetical protein
LVVLGSLEENTNVENILLEKLERKKLLGRPRHRWENNI